MDYEDMTSMNPVKRTTPHSDNGFSFEFIVTAVEEQSMESRITQAMSSRLQHFKDQTEYACLPLSPYLSCSIVFQYLSFLLVFSPLIDLI
ncbi:hypothetical protein Hanom_Chr12g01165671 [Helianthus anomalus]